MTPALRAILFHPAATPPPAGSFTTLNTGQYNVSHAPANVNLSGGSLTATGSGTLAGEAAVGSLALASGKCRWEVQVPASGVGPHGFGKVGASTMSGGGGYYGNADAISMQSNGHVYVGFTDLGDTGLSPFAAGDWIGMEDDVANTNLYFVKNGGARVGPYSYATASVPGTMYPGFSVSSSDGASPHATVNYGSSSWNTSPTSGYVGVS